MDATTGPPDALNSASTAIETYHCLCTNLIVASTTPISNLPVRASGRDKAHVLPLLLPPTNNGSDDEPQTTSDAAKSPTAGHYALLLSAVADRKPVIIRRDDGFEKRYLLRCERCRLVVGYQLDKSQYARTETESGRREDVVYLLPGGLTTTDMMRGGVDMSVQVKLI